jgi:DNA-3-methyladenine glycosylase
MSDVSGDWSLGRLPRSFYDRPAAAVARDLLGTALVHRTGNELRQARIVETEAYVGVHDLACHASKGRTRRNAVMFGPPGHAYVYFIYGMYYMLNVVTAAEGDPQAVLIRSAEWLGEGRPPLNGPGRLTRGLGIAMELNGEDLCGERLFFRRGTQPTRVVETKRIGEDYAGQWADEPLRFYDADSRHVSRR